MADEFALSEEHTEDTPTGAASGSTGNIAGGNTPNSNIIEEKESVANETGAEPATMSAAMPDNQSFTVSEEEWTALKAQIGKHYTEIANFLRYNKTRDESIQRLSAEVQKYRDGFAYSALKPFITALISLREDCRKSLRDAKEFGIDDAKAKKYTDLLVSDFEEMLSNVNLERGDDGTITLNGKPLSGEAKPRVVPEEPAANEQKADEAAGPLVDVEAINNTTELIECLNKGEEAIRLALADRTVIDKTIQAYRELAARTDAEHYFALAAPVAKQLFALFDKLTVRSQSGGNEPVKLYDTILKEAGGGIGAILAKAGVTMDKSGDGSLFDTQKHKIVKTMPTDNKDLDRTIATTYTECYTYDDKVVYQSKVDVYKFQQEKQGE